MFCKNCGANVEQGHKFCKCCGAPMDSQKSNIKNSASGNAPVVSVGESASSVKRRAADKKLVIAISVAVAAALIALVVIIAAVNIKSPQEKLAGHWIMSDEMPEDRSYSDYPGYDFYMYNDGTMTTDDISGSYAVDGDTMTISLWWESYTYKYEVHGDTLELTEKDDDESVIYCRAD